jgi:hypothetical protein
LYSEHEPLEGAKVVGGARGGNAEETGNLGHWRNEGLVDDGAEAGLGLEHGERLPHLQGLEPLGEKGDEKEIGASGLKGTEVAAVGIVVHLVLHGAVYARAQLSLDLGEDSLRMERVENRIAQVGRNERRLVATF